MIVTFRSKAHADIMMFGDIAVHLLKLMPPVNFPVMAVIRGASQTVRHFPTH